MKSIAVLAAAAVAALAVHASGALGEDVCPKAYGACMTACVEKVARDTQDTCMIACQDKKNQCSAEVFGGRQEAGPATRSSVDARKAREITSPPPRKVDVASRPADAGKDAGAPRAESSSRIDALPGKKAAADTKAKTKTAPSPVREVPAEQ